MIKIGSEVSSVCVKRTCVKYGTGLRCHYKRLAAHKRCISETNVGGKIFSQPTEIFF